MEMTNQVEGRGGDLCDTKKLDDPKLEDTLRQARKVLAFASGQLEREMDRLQFDIEDSEADKKRTDAIRKLLGNVSEAMQTVVRIQTKIGDQTPQVSKDVVINLDEARAEIESRLARLAA